MTTLSLKRPFAAFAILPLLLAVLLSNPSRLNGQGCYTTVSEDPTFVIITVYNALGTQEVYDCGIQAYRGSSSQYLIITDPFWYDFFVIPITSAGRSASVNEAQSLSTEEFMKIPELAKIKPFTGTGGCTLYSGSNSLILKPSLAEQKLADSRKAADPLAICKKDCGQPMEWAITPVNKNKAGQGFYIHPAGMQNQVLCWTAEEGLSLKARNPKIKAKPGKCSVWYMPVGSVAKDKKTGYRIVSKAAPNYGLAVDKVSGAVTVKALFEEVAKSGSEVKAMQLVGDDASIWTMGECRPLPPSHRPTEKVQD